MGNADDKLIYDEMSVQIIDAAEKLTVSEGAHNINVRKILNYLGITNRVFYNRFRNIDEVLDFINDFDTRNMIGADKSASTASVTS